jgi:hypothetical protein
MDFVSGGLKRNLKNDSSAAKMDLPACVVMCTVTPASSNHNPTAAKSPSVVHFSLKF